MALSGVHVVAGYAGGKGFEGRDLPLYGDATASETMATPATSAIVAGSADTGKGRPIFSVATSVDIYFATGPTPNAAASPRRYLKAGDERDVFVNPGDKLAWVAA